VTRAGGSAVCQKYTNTTNNTNSTNTTNIYPNHSKKSKSAFFFILF
jgi:hypothetical protein